MQRFKGFAIEETNKAYLLNFDVSEGGLGERSEDE